MKTKVYKTEKEFNKEVEELRKKSSFEHWSTLNAESRALWGITKYEDTGEEIEPWSGETTAVFFDNETNETDNMQIIVLL